MEFIYDKDAINSVDAILFCENDVNKLSEHINLKIVCINDTKEVDNYKDSGLDGWILKDSINSIVELLDVQKNKIDMYRDVNKKLNLLESFKVAGEVNCHDIQLIIDTMKHSTMEIRDIFQNQTKEMKNIHDSIKSVKTELLEIKEEINTEEKNVKLINSIEEVHQILSRTDDVIKTMYSFIGVLQCEDRLTQMLEGMSNLIENHVEQALSLGVVQPDEDSIKKEFIKFYTIQAQRDFVQGIECVDNVCNRKDIDIEEEITLF
ncbi:MAG: hypothetical protein HXX81_05820 [Campylobacterales bacterium]|nr:hypothetical protein [Campylobacterales bacterium]